MAGDVAHLSWYDEVKDVQASKGHLIWGPVESVCTDSSSMPYSSMSEEKEEDKANKEYHILSNVQFLQMSDYSSTSVSSERTAGDHTKKSLSLEPAEFALRHSSRGSQISNSQLHEEVNCHDEKSQVSIDALQSTHSGNDLTFSSRMPADSHANTLTKASVTDGTTGGTQPLSSRPCFPKQAKSQAVGQGPLRLAHNFKLGIASLFSSALPDARHVEDAGKEAGQLLTSELGVCTECHGDTEAPCASCMPMVTKTKGKRNRPSKKLRDRQKAYGLGPYAALRTPGEEGS